MKKITLYIGANNDTKVVEREKVESITSEYLEGFTIANSVGYWNGAKEDSIQVIVFSDDVESVRGMTKRLCKELKQDAILLEVDNGGELITA